MLPAKHFLPVLILPLALSFTACDDGGEKKSNSPGHVQQWIHPADVTDYITSTDGYSPKVAMSNNGDAVIVWKQSNSTSPIYLDLYMKHYHDGTWSDPEPVMLQVGSFESPSTESVAMDAQGNAVIAFSTVSRVYRSEYRNWGTTETPDWHWEHPDSDDYFNPEDVPMPMQGKYAQVAMDDNGNAIIVWQQEDQETVSHPQIFRSEYRNWGTAETPDWHWVDPSVPSDNISPDPYNTTAPQVAMDNNGNAIIVWQQQVTAGSDVRILMSEYRNPGTGWDWDDPEDIDDYIANGYNWVPKVAMSDNGDAVIIWSRSMGSYSTVIRKEYRSNTWYSNTGLGSSFTTNSLNPDVAMDSSGNAVMAWQQYDSEGVEHIFRIDYRSGAWGDPAAISPVDGTDIHCYAPGVAMSDNGTSIITWGQYGGAVTEEQVFISEYRNGSWDNPDSMTDNISPDETSVTDPDIAMDSSGNAIIIWDQTGDGYATGESQIFMSEFR